MNQQAVELVLPHVILLTGLLSLHPIISVEINLFFDLSETYAARKETKLLSAGNCFN